MAPNRFQVFLTAGAERDLESLHEFVAAHDSPASADHLLDRLMEVVEDLATFPERGSHPRELLALGIKAFRQVFFKPYRVIYRVRDEGVYVYLIADGRRDLRALLDRRVLGAG
ncbi:MAG: type II toxin-antitoxin system RelE/ParE family toxin [Pseudomonadota bacterium]